ncbi:MAG: alpha/beta hydrolase [Theionarchaea archaeon]|nr:alpha/beta hydrolase [Theionarchaea archaeon]
MIFIHGAGLNASIWTHQIHAFPHAHFPTLERTPAHPPSVHDFTNFLASYMTVHEMEPPVLVGHSLGGGIAMDFALTYPHLIRGLILVCASPVFRVPPDFLEMILSDFVGFIQTIISMGFSPHAPESTWEACEHSMKTVGAVNVYHDYVCANSFDIQDQIDKITAPTLILAAAEDTMIPLEISTFLSERVENSCLRIIPGSGHMLILEQPAQVNAEIASFIDRLG